MNSGQQIVRGKIQELSCRILQGQHLLAAVDRLECHICSDNITLADDVVHCKGRLHCFHAHCARHLAKRGRAACPQCGCELIAEVDLMIESVARYTQRLHSSSVSNSSRCCSIQKSAPESVRA